jgi:HAD superfamily hydrolase (TIGR01509 family)
MAAMRQGSGPRGFLGVVFDLDGVVADSEPLHIRAWVQVLDGLGVGPESLGRDVLAAWVGVPDAEIVGGLAQRFALPLTAEQLLDRKRAAYRALVPEALAAFPGVPEELASWDGVPLGMATATPRREAELMLRTLGLTGVFRVLITRDDVQRPKPAPDCYLLAASRLGLDPARCAAVEDAPYGVKAARAAGMHVLGVTTSYPAERLGEAHRLFSTVPQAIRWLKQRVA